MKVGDSLSCPEYVIISEGQNGAKTTRRGSPSPPALVTYAGVPTERIRDTNTQRIRELCQSSNPIVACTVPTVQATLFFRTTSRTIHAARLPFVHVVTLPPPG